MRDDDLDENKYSYVYGSVDHSLAYADLPQKYYATVSYVESRVGPVGEINFEFTGNNSCSFSVGGVYLSNERQGDYSQTLSVVGQTSQSVSCPTFDLEVQYWEDNERLLHKSALYAVDAGEFTDSVNLPEFFGNVVVRVVMTPTEGDAHYKYADSSVISIKPEQCRLSLTTVAEQPTFDRQTGKVTTREQHNLTYTEHWCHLDNISVGYATHTEPEVDSGVTAVWDRHSEAFAELTGLGYITSRTFGNYDFCYASALTATYTAWEGFPGQYDRYASSQTDPLCHVGHCTLHGLELGLGRVYSPEHPIREPNYKVAANLSFNVDIEQFDNCADLLVNVNIQFSEDGWDFETVRNFTGNNADIAPGIHNTATNHIGELAEENDGFYRVCAEVQLVEPNLYERPIESCSNAVRHRPVCEYEINRFEQVSSRPSADNDGYVHDFEFDGFQNKWCGDMLATTQVVDPLGGVYEAS